MSEQVKRLLAAAAKLDREDQSALVEALQAGLLPGDAAIEAAWADEAQDRLLAYQRGDIEAEDSDAALIRMRATLETYRP